MGYDYYVIKQLNIYFTYDNKKYEINEQIAKTGKYFLSDYSDADDSDDEYYYMKYLKAHQTEMNRYNYSRIIFEENYNTSTLKDKYENMIIKIINNHYSDIDYSEVLLEKVEKIQYSKET